MRARHILSFIQACAIWSMVVMTPVAAPTVPTIVMPAIAMPTVMTVTMAMAATDLDHRLILGGGQRRHSQSRRSRRE
jgi:hypothetical protein